MAENKSIEERVEEILDSVIRPAVGEHGGFADLNYIENGVAYIDLSGACAGCPSADTETRDFIERQLTNAIPEITRVEIDNTLPADIFDEVRAMFSKSYGNEK